MYASRIEGMDDNTITVATPADLRAAQTYDIGLEVDVVWAERSGIHAVPTQLAETSVQRNLRLWHLEITGSGWTEQRRDYVRVPLTGRVVLTPVLKSANAEPGDLPNVTAQESTDNVGDIIEAQFVDLSEVAAQVAVGLARDDRRIALGRAVQCAFTLNGANFEIRGKIAIVRPGTSPRESRAVVAFEHSRVESDALRKEVFRIQVAIRREQQG